MGWDKGRTPGIKLFEDGVAKWRYQPNRCQAQGVAKVAGMANFAKFYYMRIFVWRRWLGVSALSQ